MDATWQLMEETILEGRFGLMLLNLTQIKARKFENGKTYLSTCFDVYALRMLQRWLADIDFESEIVVQSDAGLFPESVYSFPCYCLIINGDLEQISFNIWLACFFKVVPDWVYRSLYEEWLTYYQRKWRRDPYFIVTPYGEAGRVRFIEDDQDDDSQVFDSIAAR
jgi:hypothetical protein